MKLKWDTKLIVLAVIGLAVAGYIWKRYSQKEIVHPYPFPAPVAAEAPTGYEEAETVDLSYPPPLFISKPALSPIWQNLSPYPHRIDYPYPSKTEALNLPAYQGHAVRVIVPHTSSED